jgi:hypothetical protein
MAEKYSPVMALVGFLALYYTKGFSNLVPNLQGLASNFVGQVQQNWQSLAMAAAAAVVFILVKKMKMPIWLKVVILLVAALGVGYFLGQFVDPPVAGGTGTVRTAGRAMISRANLVKQVKV